MRLFEPKPLIIDAIPESGHCVIEASAGTGKTYTIQKLFLDLLLRGYRPQDFLIVTFTRKATAELHDRLKSVVMETLLKCSECGEMVDPGGARWEIDAAQRKVLEVSLSEFHRAQVRTLDSLTQFILRENMDIAMVQSDARVQYLVPMVRAFEHFTRDIVPEDPWLIAMMASYSCYYHEKWDSLDVRLGYTASPESLYDDLMEFTKQPAELTTGVKFPDDVKDSLGLFSHYQAWFEVVRKALQGEDWASQWAVCQAGFERVCEKKGRGKGLAIGLSRSLERFCACMREAEAHDWLRIASFWSEDREGSSRVWGKVDASLIRRYESEMQNEVLRAIFSLRLYGFSKEYFVAEYAVSQYRQCMQKFHIEQAAYQFATYTDMLCETLRSVEGEELASRLRRRWKIVIVDEFQDTSPAQWEVLERCFMDKPEESRLFLIGDPKQAIYAFRGGDIYTYKKAVQDIRLRFGDDHILALTSNYRSTPAILEAVNRFYYRPEETGEDDTLFSHVDCSDKARYDYRNVYSHEIGAGHGDWVCLRSDGSPCSAVSLIPIDDTEGSQKTWDEALADAIAAEIQHYMGDGCPWIQKSDVCSRFKKIYVLGRNNNDFKPLEKRLVLAGIPFVASRSDVENLYTEPEILEFTRIMMAIGDPLKKGYLEAALHTTFFGLNAREVACLSKAGDSALLGHFKRWSEMSRYPQKFRRIFEEVLDVTQYAARLSLFSYTQRPYEHVCRVIDALCARALYDGMDWQGLLDWMHQMRRGEASEDGVPSMPVQAQVQFLTIHKCKGLEADAVFLFYPREYSMRSKSYIDESARYYHVMEGDRWKRVMRPPKSSVETLEAAFFEASQEDERLLYVALTRASARLYLPRYLSVKSNDGGGMTVGTEVKMPDIYRRLQRVLCKCYGDEVPNDMLPLYQYQSNASSQIKTTLNAAYEQFVSSCALGHPEDSPQRVNYVCHQTASYSSLKHRSQLYRGATIELVPSVWHDPIRPAVEMRWPELPKGRNTGLFLHAVFERIPYDAVYRLRDKSADTWLEDIYASDVQAIRRIFNQCAREYQFSDSALQAAQRLVFLTLTTRQVEFAPEGLCGVDGHQAEVEFLVRYDAIEGRYGEGDIELCQFFERAIGDADFGVRDGDFLTGSIDCCYRIGDTWYILDWKSDSLDDYSPSYLRSYVDEHYDYQVAIYRHAFKRMIKTMVSEDSAYHFGGIIYVFIRGISPGTHDGFVFLPETEV